MNPTTGPSRGRARGGVGFWAGSASFSASRTSRRCTPNFRATPWIVPIPNSYSRRISSNSSTVALLRRMPPPPPARLVHGWAIPEHRSGPDQNIEHRDLDAGSLTRLKWQTPERPGQQRPGLSLALTRVKVAHSSPVLRAGGPHGHAQPEWHPEGRPLGAGGTELPV